MTRLKSLQKLVNPIHSLRPDNKTKLCRALKFNTMETIPNNFDAIIDHLESLSDRELINLHNTYCQENSSADDEIHENDEDFFNTYFDGKVMEAVRAVSFGEYKYSDKYVRLNGYGNLESFNSASDEIDLSEIANDILENPERYDIELEESVKNDKNGNALKIGDLVNMPYPESTDSWAYEFTGTIDSFNGEYVVVVDGDGDYFDIEPERLEKESE